MYKMIGHLTWVLTLAAGLTFAMPAQAQMGKAPVGPGGVYGGFDVGFSEANEPKSQINTTAPVTLFEADPESGIEFGAHFGFVLTNQVLGLANPRIEGSFSHTTSEDDGNFLQPGGFPWVRADAASPFRLASERACLW